MMPRAALVSLSVLILLAVPLCSFAETKWQGADLPPGEILSDPEALGLGAVKSLRGSGARGAFGNPAGLVELAGNAIVFDGSEGPGGAWPSPLPALDIRFEGGHGIPQDIAYGHSFGRYALGAGFTRTYQASFEARDAGFAENVSYRMEAYQLAGGWRANDWLSLGLGARVVSGTGTEVTTGMFNFSAEDTKLAFGGSVGAKAKLDRIDLSFLAEGGTNLTSDVTVESFPETLVAHQPLSVRLGGEFQAHPLIRILAEAAYYNRSHYGTSLVPDNFRSTVDGSAGVEVRPGASSPLLLRAGLLRRTDPFNEGGSLIEYGQTFLTLGVGLRAKEIDLDFAMATSAPFEDVNQAEIEQTHWAGGVVLPF